MWFVFLVNVFTLIPAIVFVATPKATDTMWVVIIRTFGCIFLAATTCGTFVLMATGRLQIREKGLWTYWGLVCWKDLANHEWKKKHARIPQQRFRTLGDASSDSDPSGQGRYRDSLS